MPLALSAVLATCAWAQANIAPNAVRDQLNQSSAAPAASQGSSSQPQQGANQADVKMPKKPAPAAKAPASASTPAAAKTAGTAPAKAQAATPAKPAAPAKAAAAATTDKTKAPTTAKAAVASPDKTKPVAPAKAPVGAAENAQPKAAAAAKAPSKPETKPVKAETASAEKAPEEKPVVHRDPFDTLLTKAKASNAAPENLPPGKAGLVVATLRIDGIVHSPNGMIAIVSNPQQRVYFLRDGDKLYDGSVDRIALNSISFHEIGRDAFGKPLERTVTKQLYPTGSGEQQ